MQNIKVNIDPQGLKATVTITASEESFPTREELIKALKDAGIRYGVSREKFERILREKQPVYNQVIAVGKSPVMGKPARLVWDVPLEPKNTEEEKRIDFKEGLKFVPVKEGQVLVTKIPAQAGVDGRSVKGEIISSLGEDIPLPAGSNVTVSEDGLKLLAAMDGSAYWQQGKIHIDKVLQIKGDVSYGTGNVKFNGPVVIEGDVRSGFRVEARDSIMIGGNVEAAHIYSQQGDITIKYGVVGKNRAKILAGGSLTCGFIQDATIGVRGDLTVYHYIINSSVSVGGMATIKGEEGQIRGGNLTAEKGIVATVVGSPRNIYTELKIIGSGQNSSQRKLWELSRIRTDLTLRFTTLEKRFKFLNILKKEVKNLSEERLAELSYLEGELKRLKNRLMQLDDEEIVLQKEAARERLLKEVVVEGKLYPNVHIEINGLGFHADETFESIKIYRFKDELLVESLKEMTDERYDIFVPGDGPKMKTSE